MNKEVMKALNDAELIKFATEFSDNFTIYSCGDYVSDDKNYHIRYSDELKGMESNSWARSSNETNKIELCRKDLVANANITNNYVFFMIIWCVAVKLVKNNSTFMETDRITCDFYITTKRNCVDVICGWEEQFALNETKENKERLDIMRDILIRYNGVSDAHKIKQDLLDLAMKKFGINSSFSLTKKAIFLAMDNFADIIYRERIAEKEHEEQASKPFFLPEIENKSFHDNFCEMVKIINLFLLEEKQLKQVPTEQIDTISKVFSIQPRQIDHIELFAGSCRNPVMLMSSEEKKNHPELVESTNTVLKSTLEKRELFSNNLIDLLHMLNFNWMEQTELLSTGMVEELFTRFEIKKR